MGLGDTLRSAAASVNQGAQDFKDRSGALDDFEGGGGGKRKRRKKKKRKPEEPIAGDFVNVLTKTGLA